MKIFHSQSRPKSMQDANRDTGWTWKRIEKWHNFETRRTSRSRVAEREQAKAQFCTERQESSRARQLWRKSTSLFMSIIGDISTFKSESPFCSPSFPNLFQVQLDKKRDENHLEFFPCYRWWEFQLSYNVDSHDDWFTAELIFVFNDLVNWVVEADEWGSIRRWSSLQTYQRRRRGWPCHRP